jgi:hypothetical protein
LSLWHRDHAVVTGQADQPLAFADLIIQELEELTENPVDVDQVRE